MNPDLSQDQSNDRSDVYYQGKYWNDLEEVRAHLHYLSTGDSNRDWIDKILTLKSPGHTLILNCGNGWVERELFDRGLITSALALDISPTLIQQATELRGNRDITYVCNDINCYEFQENKFDFVINFAAIHHTRLIDRTMRGVWFTLKKDGLFVSWDYIGPHRNQYSYEVWEKVWKVNETLPSSVRSDMSYPHLPTMLAMDPTEAIHSELFLEVHNRYFRTIHQSALGGAIAYPLLTHNAGIHSMDAEIRQPYVNQILVEDLEFTDNKLEKSLFVFIASGRREASELNEADLQKWTEEESQRERVAEKDGKYYEKSLLQHLTQRIVDLQDQLKASAVVNKVSTSSPLSVDQRLRRLEKSVEALNASHRSNVKRFVSRFRKFLRRASFKKKLA